MDLVYNDVRDYSVYFENISDLGKSNLLHEVMRHGDIRATHYLIKHITPLSQNNSGETPLSAAIGEGHTYLVKGVIDFITDKDDEHLSKTNKMINAFFANKSVSLSNELETIYSMLSAQKRRLVSQQSISMK
jgi:ankyrin repeat protein